MSIEFINETNTEKLSEREKNRIREWINKIITEEKKTLGEIYYTFVSEETILKINKKYLNHNYITDVITFDSSVMDVIHGEIFICIEEVIENSKIFEEGNERRELLRVMIHGILHLCGYEDKSAKDKNLMRKKETEYIAMY